MNPFFSFNRRILITSIISIIEWGMLLWDYFHDGVPTHYLLHDENLPGFSNWWGGLLIPIFTWVSLTFIAKRYSASETHSKVLMKILFGAIVAAAISISFKLGNDEISASIMLAIIFTSLFIHPLKVEYFLGFILGMVVVFGGVLPFIISGVLALIFLITGLIRKAVVIATKKLFS